MNEPCSDNSKRVQGNVVDKRSLIHLLDTMHVGSDVEMDFNDPETWNDYGFNKEEDVWDVKADKHPVWNEAMLVPPSMVPEDEPIVASDDLFGLFRVVLIICFYCTTEIRRKVVECFSTDAPQTTVVKLRKYEKEEWAQNALISMENIDPFVLEVIVAEYTYTVHANCLKYRRGTS